MSNNYCPACKGKKRVIDTKAIGKFNFYFNQRGERVPHIDCPNCTKPFDTVSVDSGNSKTYELEFKNGEIRNI